MMTIDELSIIKLYSGFSPNRVATLAALKAIVDDIPEPEIKATVESTIRKVNAMGDETFVCLDLVDVLGE